MTRKPEMIEAPRRSGGSPRRHEGRPRRTARDRQKTADAHRETASAKSEAARAEAESEVAEALRRFLWLRYWRTICVRLNGAVLSIHGTLTWSRHRGF